MNKFGFKLISENKVEEINSIALLYEHEKSGARLLYLKNDDDNKVFSIGFRTPPKNSTGVAHILEHSVLCGSKKFPVKEPFVELIKGSLNTFLNAMTFADKTMYPVASKNNKDFMNLMDVYMDAVLNPNIYNTPEILMQEGWHYELKNEKDNIQYKGVVYNEMKGAFSSPDSILMRKISETLFKDTTYGFESGGDPDCIPDLTYDEFIDFHKKYYHPSNSYIFLYGDMNIDGVLKFLDSEYLSNYEKINVDSKIKIQKPFSKVEEKDIVYPITPNEKSEKKTFLSMNYVVGKSTDKELYLSMDILEHMLLETSAAPLKKALLEANVGEDIFGMYDNSILQPTLSVVAKNSDEEKKGLFIKVIDDTLNNLVNNGIDKKLIESSINIKEFSLREADYAGYPKGLIYAIKCMDSWLYDEDPLIHLEYNQTISRIKEAAKGRYFEELIEKYLLNNTHSSILILKPQKGLEEEKTKSIREKLSKFKDSLYKKDIEQIVQNTNKLIERQNSADSPEALKSIPLLSLNDIDPNIEKLPLTERKFKDIKILFSPIFTNDISYLDFYFATDKVPQNLIPYITLLSSLLTKVDTEKYSYEELSNEININTGGIYSSIRTYVQDGNDKVYYPKLVIKAKALVQKHSELSDLISEVLKSKFNNKKRIKEIIMETKSHLEMRIFDEGHAIASARALSYFSPAAKYMDISGGFSFYKFILQIDKQFDEKWNEILENLQRVSEIIFNRNNLVIGVTTEEKDYNDFEKIVENIYKDLNSSKSEKIEYQFGFNNSNEGLVTSGKVQYVSKAANFKEFGYKYSGSLLVLRTILRFDYLWNKVRVQGGAYGCSAMFSRTGNMYFSSYRDPNLSQTIGVYDSIDDYVKNFTADEREMTKYVIGTISDLDLPLTPSMKGSKAIAEYFSNVSYEEELKERREIISTTVSDIRGFSNMLRDTMKENYLCVLGNEAKINSNKNLFNNIIDVFE